MDMKTKKILEIGAILLAGGVAVYFIAKSGSSSQPEAETIGADPGLASVAAASSPAPAPFYQTYAWPKIDPDLIAGNLTSIIPTPYVRDNMQSQPGDNQNGCCNNTCGCSDASSLLSGNLLPTEESLNNYYNDSLKGFADAAAKNMLSSIPVNIAQFINTTVPDGKSQAATTDTFPTTGAVIAQGGTPGIGGVMPAASTISF